MGHHPPKSPVPSYLSLGFLLPYRLLHALDHPDVKLQKR